MRFFSFALHFENNWGAATLRGVAVLKPKNR
jgi:hypothetical protein